MGHDPFNDLNDSGFQDSLDNAGFGLCEVVESKECIRGLGIIVDCNLNYDTQLSKAVAKAKQ